MTRCAFDDCTNAASFDVCEGLDLCEEHSRWLHEREIEGERRAERGWYQHCEDQAALNTEPEPEGEWEWLHGLYEEEVP